MQLLTAPNEIGMKSSVPSIFLAGGISGCDNWQDEMIHFLRNTPLLVVNPRQPVAMNRKDVRLARAQIAWERRYIREVKKVCFWFPKETLCPIALFELGGRWENFLHDCNHLNLNDVQDIYVGCDRDYDRIIDIELQREAIFGGRLLSAIPPISYSLGDLASKILSDL